MGYSDELLKEVEQGQGIKLSVLAEQVPSYRNGKPATFSRVYRWVIVGCKNPNGEGRVYLEALKSPGGWISTHAAMARFFAALTPELRSGELNLQKDGS